MVTPRGRKQANVRRGQIGPWPATEKNQGNSDQARRKPGEGQRAESGQRTRQAATYRSGAGTGPQWGQMTVA